MPGDHGAAEKHHHAKWYRLLCCCVYAIRALCSGARTSGVSPLLIANCEALISSGIMCWDAVALGSTLSFSLCAWDGSPNNPSGTGLSIQIASFYKFRAMVP